MEAERLRRGVTRGMSMRYRLFRRCMVAIGRLLFGFTVYGAEKVSKEGPLIVAANHRRNADPVLVSMAVPRRIQWMAKKELFGFPFKRFFFFIGAFPVDRESGRSALRTALNLLKAGWALGIFPEGQRRRKGYDNEDAPKSGVAMLAARGGVPVIPVYVGRIPGPLERLRGGKLHVCVGDPIIFDNTERRGGRAYEEFTDELLRMIYGLGGDDGGGRSS